MRSLLLFTATLIPASSLAETTTKDLCDSIGTMAESAMKARQHGADMQKMIDAADSLAYNEALKGLYRSVVIAAFDFPRMNAEENQAVAVSDFKNKWYLSCFKSMVKD